VKVRFHGGDTVLVAGDPTGKAVNWDGDHQYSGNVWVDDAMELSVQHADGSVANWSNEWDFYCEGDIYPSPPQDVSSLFDPGLNIVHVTLKDVCGSYEGNSPLYFIGTAGFARAPHSPAIPYLNTSSTGWSYHNAAQGHDEGFQSPLYDDSHWPLASAPFSEGEANLFCPASAFGDAGATPVTGRGDLLLRRHVPIPGDATDIVIMATVEGSATIFVNGHDLQTVHPKACRRFNVILHVPSSDLSPDTVLAVRAQGSIPTNGDEYSRFFDLQVTGIPVPYSATTTTTAAVPVFTAYPQGTFYPSEGKTFDIGATAHGAPVRITWTELPLAPVKVTCTDVDNPAQDASVSCAVVPTVGEDLTDDITFIASDSEGIATHIVTVGPAYYFAMGDSYASGEGAPPFAGATDLH
jgi:hypothetical protein